MDSLLVEAAQKQSGESNSVKTKVFKTAAEAEEFYLYLMPLLLNVNGWTSLTNAAGGKYHLFNPQAAPKTGSAAEDDFIRFSHTNANPEMGGGEQWYRIERIITKLHNNDRSTALVIRPTKVKIGTSNVTYSFDSEVNHTLLLQLNQATVAAGVYTKNEEPATTITTDTPGLYDKIRNAFGSIFNWANLPKNQWAVLMESLLK